MRACCPQCGGSLTEKGNCARTVAVLGSIAVVVDDSVPPGTVELRDSTTGAVQGVIKNVPVE